MVANQWQKFLVCGWLAITTAVRAQSAPDHTIGEALRSLAARADLVLVGQVVGIERAQDSVAITLRVDQTIAGSAPAQFTFREWAGRWPPGTHRYVVGQRAMIFLHGASAAGFRSPVDGMEGVVPLVPMGAGNDPLLDVRRLFTRVLREQTAALPPAESSAIALSEAAAVVAGWRNPVWKEPTLRGLPPGVAPATTVPQSTLPVRRSGPIQQMPADAMRGPYVR